MSVSGVSNIMGNLIDMTATNQGDNKRTMEIAGVTTELKFLELDHPVELTISKEAKEKYREMLKPYQIDLKEELKMLDIFRNGTILDASGLEPILNASMKELAAAGEGKELTFQEKAEDLLGAYAKLYDEISQGDDNAAKGFYVFDNKANLIKLTKEEALAELDRAYGKISECMETSEKVARVWAKVEAHIAKDMAELAELKESRGWDATEERNFLRDYKQKKQPNKASDDIEIEGFSKKMLDVINDFKEQYGKKDIHTILSEMGLFERLKGDRD